LKVILSQLWPYFGLPPERISALYYAFPYYSYLCGGGYYPKGGSATIAVALQEAISDNGGVIKLNSCVTKIIIDKGRASGVKTQTGDEFFSKIIISNIDSRKTFFNLVGPEYLPKCFASRIEKMQPSISAFQLYLGLNINLKDRGVNDYEIFFNPSYDTQRQFLTALNQEIDEEVFTLTIYSNIDSTVAPKGKSVVGITTLSGYDVWLNLSKEEYEKKKQEMAKILIKKVEEKIIPDLSLCIEKIEMATPLTMERYTGNSKGAIYGWSQIPSQSGIRRQNFKTPIKNLYLASAWTWIGGGISTVVNSGYLVAKHILIKEKDRKIVL